MGKWLNYLLITLFLLFEANASVIDDSDVWTLTYNEDYKVPKDFSVQAIKDDASIFWASERESSTGLLVHESSVHAARDKASGFVSLLKSQGFYSPLGKLIEGQHNKRFFEFFVNAHNGRTPLSIRVWRSSYLQPMTDYLLPAYDSPGKIKLGTMNRLTEVEELKWLLRNIWWQERKLNASYKVLSLPKVVEYENHQAIEMPVLSISFGDFNIRDSIKVQLWSIVIDRQTGIVDLEVRLTRTMEGKMNTGGIIMDLPDKPG